MAPDARTVTECATISEEPRNEPYKWRISVEKVFQLGLLHVLTSYSLYLMVWGDVKWKTYLIMGAIGVVGALGVTAGAHRLWTHRCYKARLPLRILLMLLNCVCFQGDVYKWARDHRVHHKFTDTDADPHNINRGFFFAHVGWLMVRKHPEVVSKGGTVDLKDILADPVVRFQKRFYFPLAFLLCFGVPTYLAVWLAEETWLNSFFVAGIFRYCLSLHASWLVNSAAHLWGYRPYDSTISPTENIVVTLLAQGEGFHNYHHAFPWDYSTSEYGVKWNLTTAFINAMFCIGQAYDLKSATTVMIRNVKRRTGELAPDRCSG